MCIPIKPYYTVNASSLLKRTDKNNLPFGNARLNLLVDTIEFDPQLYILLNSIKNEYIISLSAHLIQNITKELVYKFYLLLALNISSTKKKIVPVFSSIAITETHLNIESIATFFSQQGLSNISFPMFNYFDCIQIIDNCCLA